VQADYQRIAGLVERVATVDQVPVDGLDLRQRVGCGQDGVGPAAERRELGGEMARELNAKQAPAGVEALPENLAGRKHAHSCARQCSPCDGRDRLAQPQPRGDEALDSLVERSLADRVQREQWPNPLEGPADSCANQVIDMAHIPVDRPERDARAERDRLRRRHDVALAEQLKHGVEHSQPVPVPPGRAPVGDRMFCHDARYRPKNAMIRRRASAACGSALPVPISGPATRLRTAKNLGSAASGPAAPLRVASMPG